MRRTTYMLTDLEQPLMELEEKIEESWRRL